MRLSDNGRKLIQGFEGLSLKAYKDADGYSIGYGHFGVKPGDVITREQADRLFDQDIAKYEAAVSLVTPNATPQQFDSMVSLTYNIGTGDVPTRSKGFAGSTVARLHNMGDWQGAADAFRMWNKSGGAVLPVLTARREQERAVYLNGYPGHGYTEPVATPSASGAPIAWSVPGAQSEPLSASLGSVAPAAGLALAAGAGLLFFCPVCAARVAEIGLELKR